MRSRESILNDLVQFKGNLQEIKNELSQYPWDAEEPILIITNKLFSNIIQKCIDNEITINDLEEWANLIECRDDLDFEDAETQEFIFEFSNAEINGMITKERLNEIIKRLHE